MHQHLSEEELAELALHPHEATSSLVPAQIGDCAECATLYGRYHRLHDAVSELPRTATPGRDLLPLVLRSVDEEPATLAVGLRPLIAPKRPLSVRVLAMAASVLLAFMLGRLSVNGNEEPSAVLPSSPLGAAMDVQEAGTKYLTAVAVLTRMDAPPQVRAQGRAAALATLYGAALQLAHFETPDGNLSGIATSLGAERESAHGPPSRPDSFSRPSSR